MAQEHKQPRKSTESQRADETSEHGAIDTDVA